MALLMRGENPATFTEQELRKARKKNFSITLSKEYVRLALLEKLPSIMPFEQNNE